MVEGGGGGHELCVAAGVVAGGLAVDAGDDEEAGFAGGGLDGLEAGDLFVCERCDGLLGDAGEVEHGGLRCVWVPECLGLWRRGWGECSGR